MLRPLPFIAMRQKENQAGEQPPFVLPRTNELVNDELGPVCEVTKLRLPEHESFRGITAVAIFKSEDGRFRQGRVVGFKPTLFFAQVTKRGVPRLRLDIDEDSM